MNLDSLVKILNSKNHDDIIFGIELYNQLMHPEQDLVKNKLLEIEKREGYRLGWSNMLGSPSIYKLTGYGHIINETLYKLK